jgi:hypothetical protein
MRVHETNLKAEIVFSYDIFACHSLYENIKYIRRIFLPVIAFRQEGYFCWGSRAVRVFI